MKNKRSSIPQVIFKLLKFLERGTELWVFIFFFFLSPRRTCAISWVVLPPSSYILYTSRANVIPSPTIGITGLFIYMTMAGADILVRR